MACSFSQYWFFIWSPPDRHRASSCRPAPPASALPGTAACVRSTPAARRNLRSLCYLSLLHTPATTVGAPETSTAEKPAASPALDRDVAHAMPLRVCSRPAPLHGDGAIGRASDW